MLSSWNYANISGDYRPRQFEYHPVEKDQILFGTIEGEVVLASLADERQLRLIGNFGKDSRDAILGICWFNKHTSNFVTGSTNGKIMCGDVELQSQPLAQNYEDFSKLTSIHVNCSDERILASGYAKDVCIYDIESGKRDTYSNIHADHINISRFSHFSPHLFATSSFDRSAKTWDTRMGNKPIYSISFAAPLIMISFSPDDNFLLASSVDNDISQHFALDGRSHLKFSAPRKNLNVNYTRAYYSSSGAFVYSGSSEEKSVNILCAASGRLLTRGALHPQRRHASIYVQSLRGDPFRDHSFSALTNYRDAPQREIIQVTLKSSAFSSGKCGLESFTRSLGLSRAKDDSLSDNVTPMETGNTIAEDTPAPPVSATLPSDGLARDLESLLESAAGADLLLELHSHQIRVHSSIVAARCSLLRQRLQREWLARDCTSDPMAGAVSSGVHAPSKAVTLRVDDLLPDDPWALWSFKLALLHMYTGTVDLGYICTSLLGALAGNGFSLVPTGFSLAAPDCDVADVEEVASASTSALSPRWVVSALAVLLRTAIALQLHDLLVPVADECLARMLTPVTVLDVYHVARKFNRSDLMKATYRHVQLYSVHILTIFGPDCLQNTPLEAAVRDCTTFSPQKVALRNLARDPHSEDDQVGEPWFQEYNNSTSYTPKRATGHACAVVMNNQLVMIGGQNAYLLSGLRYLMSFDCASLMWRELQTSTSRYLYPSQEPPFGIPGGLVYHCAVELEPVTARHVLLLGGFVFMNGHNARGDIFLLDCREMRWMAAVIHGKSPPSVSRGTACVLYRCVDMYGILYDT